MQSSKDKSDFLAQQTGGFPRKRADVFLSEQPDRSGIDRLQEPDHIQEGRFSAAGSAHYRNKLARGHFH